MNPPKELSLSEIRKYMLANGCRVTNHALVKHFKGFLTDPETQNETRKQFKIYVNILATIKNENNQKYIILRKKYVNECPNESGDVQSAISIHAPELASSKNNDTPSAAFSRQPPPYKAPPGVEELPSSSICAKHSDVPLGRVSDLVSKRYISVSDRKSESNLEIKETTEEPQSTAVLNEENKISPKTVGDDVTEDQRYSIASMPMNIESTTNLAPENPVSVKEVTRKFNRLASKESPSDIKPTNKRKSDEVEIDSKVLPDVTMSHPKAKEWIVAMAKANYQELAKLLNDYPELVKLQDPATNYTALHWAAKHGNEDVVKLIAGTHKADVNARTNGGYTPLHIAMQLGRANIFALLCNTYKANRDVLDWAGNKPLDYSKQQTSISASTYSKIKAKKKPDSGFLRIGSLNVRVKKTTEVFSNFLGVGNGSNHVVHTNHRSRDQRTHRRKQSSLKKSETCKYDTTLHKSWSSADNIPQSNNLYNKLNGNWEEKKGNGILALMMPPPSKPLENNNRKCSKQLKHSSHMNSTGVDSLQDTLSSISSGIKYNTIGYSSMPTTPNQFRSSLCMGNTEQESAAIDSDSDSICGFDSSWFINSNASTHNDSNNSKFSIYS